MSSSYWWSVLGRLWIGKAIPGPIGPDFTRLQLPWIPSWKKPSLARSVALLGSSTLLHVPPYVFLSCIVPWLAFVTGRKWQSDSMALLRLGYNLSLIHTFSLGWLGLGEVMSWADPWRGPHGKEVKPPTNSHTSELGGGFSSHKWVFRDDIPGQQFDPVKGPDPEPASKAIPRFLILSTQMR